MEATKEKNRANKSLTIEEKVEILDQIGKKTYKIISGSWNFDDRRHQKCSYVASTVAIQCRPQWLGTNL